MADMTKQPMTFMSALKDFFNIPMNMMAAEYKKLTPQDREELKEGLSKVGYIIADSKPAKKDDDGPIVLAEGIKAA